MKVRPERNTKRPELDGCELVKPHWGPRLRLHRPAYLRFMRYLLKLEIVMAVAADSCHEQVGMFFVQKSGKSKLRLILDARRVNQRFRAPPGVALCSF